MRTRAQQSRDAALRRLSRLNSSLAVAAVLGTGVITDVVANTASGHTRTKTGAASSGSGYKPALLVSGTRSPAQRRAAARHAARLRAAERRRAHEAARSASSSSSSSSSDDSSSVSSAPSTSAPSTPSSSSSTPSSSSSSTSPSVPAPSSSSAVVAVSGGS